MNTEGVKDCFTQARYMTTEGVKDCFTQAIDMNTEGVRGTERRSGRVYVR